ncbi:MAG: serine--tRNA ligase [Bacteroidetes bacterium]|nr:serine--tRNA ligase [Bacteroidota bacterium]
MLSLTSIQQDPEGVARRLAVKNFTQAPVLLADIRQLDTDRRARLQELETLRAEMNRLAKQIGVEMAQGNAAAAEQAKTQNQALKQQIAQMEAVVNEVAARLDALLVQLPNLPHESVPPGKSAEDNSVIQEKKVALQLPPNPLPHWELVSRLDIIDFELGVKLTGAGFPVYKGQGARLQRALIQFFLDRATAAGYTEIQPPIFVNEASAYATGQLPDKDGQMYYMERDNLYVIPTAEVPITNLFRDVILDEHQLPVRCCGYTPCFRREAGSYGKDVRGLNRLHQFDKVEIVQITTPDASYAVLEDMLNYVRGLLDALELPYRTLLLCGGDMSFTSAKTYDMEVWSAAQERWLEVSSVSNFETYQANRLKLRYKRGKDKVICHTLNGSALALPRIVAALLENGQQADGSVRLPRALHAYMGVEYIKAEK